VQTWNNFTADAYPNAIGDVTSCEFLEGDNGVSYGTPQAPFNPQIATSVTPKVSSFGNVELQVFTLNAGSPMLQSTPGYYGYTSDDSDCNTSSASWDCPPQFDELSNHRPNFENAVVDGVTYPGVGMADYGAYQQ
jgi:hypothetical protein